MLDPELLRQVETVRWNVQRDIPWDRFEFDPAPALEILARDEARRPELQVLGWARARS